MQTPVDQPDSTSVPSSPAQDPSLWQEQPKEPTPSLFAEQRLAFIALAPITYVLTIASIIVGEESTAGLTLGVLALGTLAFSVLNWMRIHHRLWTLLPPSIRRTNPTPAVGFLFVPLLHLYWGFVSFYGLAKDANKTLKALNSPKRCNENLALVFAILFACTIIPFLGFLATLALYPFWILFYTDLLRGFEVINKAAPEKAKVIS